MKNSKNRVVASGPHRRQARPPLTPELLPSPSDELFAGAAHSRGCASGNTLAPASRGITLPWLTSVVGNRVSPVFRRLRGGLKSPGSHQASEKGVAQQRYVKSHRNDL